MEALIMAGGKGTRARELNIEKPMIRVGGISTVERVVMALRRARTVSDILVSVSPNTLNTEDYLRRLGVKTIKTSGENYVDDLHKSFSELKGEYVLSLPSDVPLIRPQTIDAFVEYFTRNENDSMLAIVEESRVVEAGVKPSYSFELNGKKWTISGVSIMNRKKLLDDVVLNCSYFVANQIDFVVNMNTPKELDVANSFLS